MMRKVNLFLICLVLTLFFSVRAHAGLGVQVDYNHFETPEGELSFLEGGDFGLGVRSDFGTSTLALVLSFDYYFPDGQIRDVNFYELNANLVFTFPTEGFRPYVGGGVGIARVSFDEDFFVDSETQTGVNILGGVKFGGGGLTPFVEGRYVIYDEEEAFANRFVLSGGIMF
jgi:opacity protein-like surface antigen